MIPEMGDWARKKKELRDFNGLSRGKLHEQTLLRARKLEERPDWPAYKPILMQVLKLLGKGVQRPIDYIYHGGLS
jgi:hypothetical protein